MSEPKLISPLLDGFSLGKPMRGHDGSRCYPAIQESTEEKYILKMISVPASQVQLDALLITGAYRDPAQAMDYFKSVADDVTREAELLETLSRRDGFLPFTGSQIVPMEEGRLGYHVCLLSPYRYSLGRYLRRNPVTHLQAVNLGLDLCAALAICRQAGYLYADLKPNNIFLTKGKGYRIGDLGFVALDSLQYTALPGKYRSPYSPPECMDDMSTLNETVDTYAAGMILYQIYNEGTLPSPADLEKGTVPSPANADYEIGAIIMKAIAHDPGSRWRNPMDMGKALVGYMQRNTINNTPIVPPSGILSGSTASNAATPSAKAAQAIPAEPEAPAAVPQDTAPDADIVPEEPIAGNPESPEEEAAPVPEAPATEPEAAAEEEEPEAPAKVLPVPELSGTTETPTQDAPVTTDTIQLSVPASKKKSAAPSLSDETKVLPVPATVGAVTGETRVFASPLVSVTEKEEEEFDFNLEEFIGELNLEEETPEPEPELPSEEEILSARRKTREEVRARKNATAGWIITAILVLILTVLGYCGFLFYQNSYLVPVESLSISGTQNELLVSVQTEKPELLTVVCTDAYGNSTEKALTGGEAHFTELLPGSLYRIELEVSGFHKLLGKTSEIFTTGTVTNIVGFTAMAGPEDGSVQLNFNVDGTESEEWTVTCTAEGEENVVKQFTGHSVTIKGLSTGKLYTFTLSAGENNLLTGETSLSYIPSKLILAENLRVPDLNGTSITVRWDAPSNTIVDSWTVRCYSDDGTEFTQEVTGTEAIFHDVDTSKGYTIEVTAAGMTQPSRTTITADPLILTDLTVSTGEDNQLTVSWTYQGNAPANGWLLLYSVDGQDNHQSVAKCTDASAVIPLMIPEATYKFTVQSADGTSVFNGVHSYTCPGAEIFSAHELSASKISAHLLKTPEKEDWIYENVNKDAFTSTFSIGDNISVVLKADANFYIPEYALDVLYVIRDEDGKVMLEYVSQSKEDWKALWYAGDYRCGELDIPKVPGHAGKFSLSIYFNGKAVVTTNFTIQE